MIEQLNTRPSKLGGRGGLDCENLRKLESAKLCSKLLLHLYNGVTFPNLREGVLSFNLQTFSSKTFLSKRFSGNKSFFKVNSPLILKCVWFGLLVSFWFFQTWSDLGFSADAHRHQVSLGLDCLSSRLVSGFIHSLSFWSRPPQSRLCRLNANSVTQHPPCAPIVSGESSWTFYDVLCI